MELMEQLILATMEELNLENYKFTMDDLAKRLGISKKTIYQTISGKEDLLQHTVEYYFNEVKRCEREIIMDDSLTLVEKFQRVLVVLPNNQVKIDFNHMSELIRKYPKVYKSVERHLDMEWEPTLNLYRMAVAEGAFRKIPEILLKTMIEGCMKEFLNSEELRRQNITYEEALVQMEDVLFRGILIEERGVK